MHVVEVVRPRLRLRARTSIRSSLAPRRDVVVVLVELHHARVGVAVRVVPAPVRVKRHEGGTVEVRRVVPVHVRRADRLHQLLAVVGELEDRVAVVVDDVDVLLRIVRADVHRVRPAQHLVPLRPVLDDVAVAIDHENAVLPEEVRAVHSGIRVVACHLRARLEERSGRARARGVAPQIRDGEREIRSDVWCLDGFPASSLRRNHRERTTLDVVDAVRALGEHTLSGPERPLFLARDRAEILGPVRHNLVRARRLERAEVIGYGCVALRTALSLYRNVAIGG